MCGIRLVLASMVSIIWNKFQWAIPFYKQTPPIEEQIMKLYPPELINPF